MEQVAGVAQIPLTGAAWATKSESYARLVSEHLSAETVWLDAGCGLRLLEDDMDPLENWLATHCKTLIGMDLAVKSHHNIKSLTRGNIYHLPFTDNSLDLITCRMVVEHLDHPARAFTEVNRCLRPGGAVIIITPNLWNYAMFGNIIATKLLKEEWRLRLVQSSDHREKEDIFPVRYCANTMPKLARLLEASGLRVHEKQGLRQLRPYWKKTASLEKVLMKLTPIYALMVCAHKPAATALQRIDRDLARGYQTSTTLPDPAPDREHAEPRRVAS